MQICCWSRCLRQRCWAALLNVTAYQYPSATDANAYRKVPLWTKHTTHKWQPCYNSHITLLLFFWINLATFCNHQWEKLRTRTYYSINWSLKSLSTVWNYIVNCVLKQWALLLFISPIQSSTSLKQGFRTFGEIQLKVVFFFNYIIDALIVNVLTSLNRFQLCVSATPWQLVCFESSVQGQLFNASCSCLKFKTQF